MAAIVFDLDGTLIDSAPDIHANVNRALQEQGAEPLPFDLVKSFIGNGVDVLLEKSVHAAGLPAERISVVKPRFQRLYLDAHELTVLYPNALSALAALASAGHDLAICTNKPLAATRAVLEHFGITDRFQAVFGGDSLAVRKPDPAPLQAAFAALGVEDGLYVGDSEVDAETAERAGVPFLLFTQGYLKQPVDSLTTAATFDDHAALLDLVSGLLAR